jgi:head-tail adaptor
MTMKINDNGTDRDMTEEEIATHEAWAKVKTTEAKASAKADAERATAKQAVLDRLGITSDEASLLLG